MSASDHLAEMLQPIGEAAVQPGESLSGVLAATEVRAFSGGTRAVVVTERRLIVQPVDRHWAAKGEGRSIPPGEIADFRVSGLGDDWLNTAISLVANSGFELRLKLTDGKKLKLMAMSGEGRILGHLGGGEFQRAGAEALLTWLQQLDQASASRASL